MSNKTKRNNRNYRGKRNHKGSPDRPIRTEAADSRDVDELIGRRRGDALRAPTPPPGFVWEWKTKTIDDKPAKSWRRTLDLGWKPVRFTEVQDGEQYLFADNAADDEIVMGGMVLMSLSQKIHDQVSLAYAEDEMREMEGIQTELEQEFEFEGTNLSERDKDDNRDWVIGNSKANLNRFREEIKARHSL